MQESQTKTKTKKKGAETQMWQGSVLAEKDLLPSSMSSKIQTTHCGVDATLM